MDFTLGLYIDRSENPRQRRVAVIASIVMNLTFLGFFKYFNFFADSLAALIRSLGMEPSWTTLNIILPVGISFYTFQSLSYTVDVYRGARWPWQQPDFIKFAAFVSLSFRS